MYYPNAARSKSAQPESNQKPSLQLLRIGANMSESPNLISRVKSAIVQDLQNLDPRYFVSGFGQTATTGIAALSIYYLYQLGTPAEITAFVTGIAGSLIGDKLQGWATATQKPSRREIVDALEQSLALGTESQAELATLNQKLGLLQDVVMNLDASLTRELLKPSELETQLRLFGTNLIAYIDRRAQRSERLQIQLHALNVAAYPPAQALPYYQGLAARLRQLSLTNRPSSQQLKQLANCEAYIVELERAVAQKEAAAPPPPGFSLEEILASLLEVQAASHVAQALEDMGVNIRDFQANYTAHFAGRNREMEHLDRWLAAEEPRIGLLIAPAGTGKSALVVNWLVHLQDTTRRIVFYPISLRFKTNSFRQMMLYLVKELCALHDEDWTLYEDASLSSLVQVFRRLLSTSLDENRQALLIVDGLDELDAPTSGTWNDDAFFPAAIGRGWHVLVTMRGEPKRDLYHWLQRLGWEAIRTASFSLDRLSREDMRTGVLQSGIDIRPEVVEPLLARLDYLTEEGDPLLFNLYVYQLLRFSREKVDAGQFTMRDMEWMNSAWQEPGLSAYLHGVLIEIGRTHGQLKEVFDALSTARGPIGVTDLEGIGIGGISAILSRIPELSRRLILGGDAARGLAFSHPKIADVYRSSPTLFSEEQQIEWRNRFRQYGAQELAKLRSGIIPPGAMSPYLLQHFVTHLLDRASTPDVQQAYAVLDQTWIQAHEAVFGTYERFLADIDSIWSYAYKESVTAVAGGDKAPTLNVVLKCALAQSSFVALASRLPPHLPAVLVRDRDWSVDQALSYTFRIADVRQRVWALLAFLKVDETRDQLSERRITDIGRSILSSLNRPNLQDSAGLSEALCCRVLLDVIPYLHDSALTLEAYQWAQQVEAISWRARVFAALAPHLPLEMQLEALVTVVELAAHHRTYRDDEDVWYMAYEEFVQGVSSGELLRKVIKSAAGISEQEPGLAPSRDSRWEQDNRKQELGSLLERLAPSFRNRLSDEYLHLCLELADVVPFCLPGVVITLASVISDEAAQCALLFMFPQSRESQDFYGRWWPRVGFQLCRDELVAAMILTKTVSDLSLRNTTTRLIYDHLDGVDLPHYFQLKESIRAELKTFFEVLNNEYSSTRMQDLLDRKAVNFEIADTINITDALLLRFMPPAAAFTAANHCLSPYPRYESHGATLRSSPTTLAHVAEALAPDHLAWLLQWAEGSEKSGRLRAIAASGARMPPDTAQRALDFVFTWRGDSYSEPRPDRLSSNIDSSMAALKSLAPHIGAHRLSTFIMPAWSGQPRDFEASMMLEELLNCLPPSTVDTAMITASAALQYEYEIGIAESTVLLASRMPPHQRLPIYRHLLDQSTYIGDLAGRIELVDNLTFIYSGRSRRRQIEQRMLGQVRHELKNPSLSPLRRSVYTARLPFRERMQDQLRRRRDTIAQGEPAPHLWRLIGSETYRSRPVLGFLRFVANLVGFVIVCTDMLRGNKAHGLSLDSPLQNTVLKILQDAAHLPLDRATVAVAKRAYECGQKFSARHDAELFPLLKRLSYPPEPTRLDALHAALLEISEVSDQGARRRRLQAFFEQDFVYLATCIDYAPTLRAEVQRRFLDLLPGICAEALDALSDTLPSDFQVSTLVVLTPVVAQLLPTRLHEIAKVAVRHGTWSDAYHRSAVLLSYVACCARSNGEQLGYIEQALEIANRRHDVSERQWTCGIVLSDAASYVSDDMLPVLARHFVTYQTDKLLNEYYEKALLDLAHRIGSDMAILEIVWPLVRKMDKRAGAFIVTVSPGLDVTWTTEVLTFILRSLPNATEAMKAVRSHALDLPAIPRLQVLDDVVHRLVDLARPQFIECAAYLTPILESLGTDESITQVAEALLDVGDWWP